jgi:ATPase involved in DNA replication initiation
MKVYISGQITGQPIEAVINKFNHAESSLRELGYEPVNPLHNGLPPDSAWEEHMLRDIATLMGCDAIFMLDGWAGSKGAQIEQFISETMGKIVLFETAVFHNPRRILTQKIIAAIQEVMGLKIEDLTAKSRATNLFYARMIAAYHCRENGMILGEIGRLINRDHSTVCHMLSKYNDEFQFNKEFRELAKKVDEIITCASI